jgi:hypothetical protein
VRKKLAELTKAIGMNAKIRERIITVPPPRNLILKDPSGLPTAFGKTAKFGLHFLE